MQIRATGGKVHSTQNSNSQAKLISKLIQTLNTIELPTLNQTGPLLLKSTLPWKVTVNKHQISSSWVVWKSLGCKQKRYTPVCIFTVYSLADTNLPCKKYDLKLKSTAFFFYFNRLFSAETLILYLFCLWKYLKNTIKSKIL